MKSLYTLAGVLGAAVALVWIAPAWIATGVYVAACKMREVLTSR